MEVRESEKVRNFEYLSLNVEVSIKATRQKVRVICLILSFQFLAYK